MKRQAEERRRLMEAFSVDIIDPLETGNYSGMDDEGDDIKFEDFLHRNCKEYAMYGRCNHMNQIFAFVATNPSEEALHKYLMEAKLEEYEHLRCPIAERNGRCNCLMEIILGIRVGDIELADIQLDNESGSKSEYSKTKVEEEEIKRKEEEDRKRKEDEARLKAEAKRKADEEE